MADFCKQCSIELFGEDFGDLRGISPTKLTKEDIDKKMGWVALCEGCGFIIVNDEGTCICPKCEKHSG